MIDLHCHILPRIDDGAKDISEAKEMLTMQHVSGVEGLILTPHFYPEEKDIETFLMERENAWGILASACTHQNHSQLRLGAEVQFCEQLLELDLKSLTLERLIDCGVLAQVSAQSLFDRRDQNFSVACLRHGLAQIVASDSHNTTARKPCMEEVWKLPEELQQLHNAITSAVWDNELPPYIRTTTVKKTFFGHR